MSVPSRQADEALDRLAEALATYHEMRGGETYADQRAEQRKALATVRSELGRLREESDVLRDKLASVEEAWQEEGERARRLEDGLREITTWFKTEPWKGSPDRGSFGGHGPYSPAERDLGYGTYRDPRFLPALLAGADEPDGGGAK